MEPAFHFKTHQRIYLALKRGIDIFGSILGILLLSPVLLFCAIITKATSKGPALFKQKRLTKNQKEFTMLKFRSMRVDAPDIPQEHLVKSQKDGMVTKWGKFMRKTSLDELPQLFNVLSGSMSFIGPRPGMLRPVQGDLIDDRLATNPSAFMVKSGLSGYAQLYLRTRHDDRLKAEYDSYYVAHLSLWFDLKLFTMSFLLLFGFMPKAKGE